jgi:hypothetical protein
MTPGSAETPNRSRWMRAGRECMQPTDLVHLSKPRLPVVAAALQLL